MDVELIRAALHRQPFEPLIFRLVDGRQLYVPHPDFVAVSRRQVHVIDPVDERVSWLEPESIRAVETVSHS